MILSAFFALVIIGGIVSFTIRRPGLVLGGLVAALVLYGLSQ